MRAERLVQDEVTGFVEPEPKRSTGKELHHRSCLGVNGRRSTAEHGRHGDPSSRGTHVAALPIEAQHLL